MRQRYPFFLAEKIWAIRKFVERMNSDTSYSTVTLENEEFMTGKTDGGGELTGYLKEGRVQKISTKTSSSCGYDQYDYYFRDTELIFVNGMETTFQRNDSTSAIDRRIHTVSFQCHYYFNAEMVIYSRLRGQSWCSGNPKQDHGERLIMESKRLVKLLAK